MDEESFRAEIQAAYELGRSHVKEGLSPDDARKSWHDWLRQTIPAHYPRSK